MQRFITHSLQELHRTLQSETGGKVADYIPGLATADPALFGIALVTVDGHVHQVGDSLVPFSIQSISKAFTYGVALGDSGAEALRAKIDVEPSGEAFNSISLEPETGRPRNPMINAGAVVATSLVAGEGSAALTERIRRRFSDFAARDLQVDEAIYLSEKETGYRNRAIANLLRNYDILEGDPEEPLDAYFRQCSILVTAQDLAVMAATLANRGVNPITSVPVLDEIHVPDVLSVMSSCGMYDYSGNWIRTVGMPAKSGVGGGIMAVLPGQFGLAVYSPPLDEKGNSVRGIKVCTALSGLYELHMLNSTRHTTRNTVRAMYTMQEVSSRFERDAGEARLLLEQGGRVLVCELTGEQSFIATEELASRLLQRMEKRDILVLDFEHMTGSDHATAKVLVGLLDLLSADGKQVILSGLRANYGFHRKFAASGAFNGNVRELGDLDDALESCEEFLLGEKLESYGTNLSVPLENQPLLAGLNDQEIEWVRGSVVDRVYRAGETIFRRGDEAEFVCLVEQGRVDIEMDSSPAKDETDDASACSSPTRSRKVASFCGGAVIGEAAFFTRGVRSANVIAVDEVRVFCFDPDELERRGGDEVARSALACIYRNLAKLEFERLSTANRVLMTLTG